jgi:hypothetical protein
MRDSKGRFVKNNDEKERQGQTWKLLCFCLAAISIGLFIGLVSGYQIGHEKGYSEGFSADHPDVLKAGFDIGYSHPKNEGWYISTAPNIFFDPNTYLCKNYHGIDNVPIGDITYPTWDGNIWVNQYCKPLASFVGA